MKTRLYLLLAASLSLPLIGTSRAAETIVPVDPAAPTQPVVTTPAPVTVAADVKLPYGVEDVLKLTRAQINEDVVLSYIHSSGTIYSLSPNDIVYLRQQGVSDRIVNAMLQQRAQGIAASQAQIAQAQAQAAQSQAAVDNSGAQQASGYAPPADSSVAYVQSQPSSSSVYVIPYPQASYAYYGYPYYYPSYGYYGPSISFGFGFGGYRGYHGYYRGGYHGGYHGGGHHR
jgi:hypothetical protein